MLKQIDMSFISGDGYECQMIQGINTCVEIQTGCDVDR